MNWNEILTQLRVFFAEKIVEDPEKKHVSFSLGAIELRLRFTNEYWIIELMHPRRIHMMDAIHKHSGWKSVASLMIEYYTRPYSTILNRMKPSLKLFVFEELSRLSRVEFLDVIGRTQFDLLPERKSLLAYRELRDIGAIVGASETEILETLARASKVYAVRAELL